MAEDPKTWGEAERIVYQALREADEARRNFVAGLSTPRRITDALRKEGLLNE